MIFKKIFSPAHQQLYSCLVALLLLLSLQAEAQLKHPQKEGTPKGYGKASYTASSFGKPMKHWLIAGPVLMLETEGNKPDAAKQELFFATDAMQQVTVNPKQALSSFKANEQELKWFYHAAEQNIVDFDVLFNKADFAAGYALAEVKAEAEQKAFLAIGSDDGLKVWLNGKLVHENWVPRSITADEDLISLQLRKGSNQLLIKIQDIEMGWGFTARFLDKAALSDRLVDASGKGVLDEIELLLASGADINKKNAAGLTPVNAAKLAGRQEVVSLLLEKGAVEAPMPDPEALADQLFTSLQGKEAPGIAVLISKGGKIVYKKGFGYADIDKKVLISPETKFRIGSNTKQFVAASLLKLQEEGKLQLTDKLSKYFPGFPRGDEVTLHHLLTHTSGIHSYTNNADFISRVHLPISPEALVTEIKKAPYDFNPGDAYNYNNSGYFLAGLIVEKVSGKSLDQYLKDTFFNPLQMHNTGIHTASLSLTNEAIGYEKEGGAYKPGTNWDMSWAGGAGALYSTVDDLFKWNEALYGGKVLSDASYKAALTPAVLNDGSTTPVGYGYGLMMGSYRNQDVVMHGGGLNGFISQLARYPQEQVTVVLLTNVTPTEQHLNPNTLAEYYLWEKMEPQQAFKIQSLSAADLKKYEGRYDFGNGNIMMITAEDTTLYAQLTGQGRYQIFPFGPDEYFWKVVDARIKFVADEAGSIMHGEFQQNGSQLKVARLEDKKVVAVDPKVFEALKGTYDFGNSFVIDISTEGGKLFAQATNSPKVELLPLSENEYFTREFNAHVSFRTEPDKQLTILMLDLGGNKREAPKSK
jgi:CubicO group peptidase (beta-lactamase class C family)